MVIHLYRWDRPPYKRVIKLSEEDYAFMLLAGIDPVAKYIRGQPSRCHCPKIGQRHCKKCLGERIYYHGTDSKELRRYTQNEQV